MHTLEMVPKTISWLVLPPRVRDEGTVPSREPRHHSRVGNVCVVRRADHTFVHTSLIVRETGYRVLWVLPIRFSSLGKRDFLLGKAVSWFVRDLPV